MSYSHIHETFRTRWLALALAFIAASGPLGLLPSSNTNVPYTPQTVSVTLVAQAASIEVQPGTFFNMWSYNGTVPGPLLRVNVGDTLQVRLMNQHNLKHSLHVHGLTYDITSDGSQGDPGRSDLGIISPGQEYTYTFRPERPGLYVYHCHSSDAYEPSVHVQQGLYGAIIVDDPSKPLPSANREYVLFLGEAYGQVSFSMFHGCAYCFGNAKHFTINARTMPLTPTITAKPGELVRIYLLNVGNDIHSFHLHGHQMNRWRIINGEWASVTVRNDNKVFVPMEAAILDVRAQTPGKWLYHCHVEPHADSGMRGIFEVQEGTVTRDLSVTSVQAPDFIYRRQVVAIRSEVVNQGQTSEVFFVETLTYDGTAIMEEPVSWLNPGSSALLTFYWNTTNIAPGTYQITAQIPRTSGETDVADNTYSITVTVLKTGDTDGDGDVDLDDLINTFLNQFTVNPRYDIDGDTDVDLDDLIDVFLNQFT